MTPAMFTETNSGGGRQEDSDMKLCPERQVALCLRINSLKEFKLKESICVLNTWQESRRLRPTAWVSLKG